MSKKNRSSQAFQGVVDSAKPGETRKEQLWRFATELKPDKMWDCLWKPGSSQSDSIVIRKVILTNLNGEGDGLGDGIRYPVFHVYNNLDPSKAATPDSSCRVNPPEKPYRTLREAMRVARKHFADALASGAWVTLGSGLTK